MRINNKESVQESSPAIARINTSKEEGTTYARPNAVDESIDMTKIHHSRATHSRENLNKDVDTGSHVSQRALLEKRPLLADLRPRRCRIERDILPFSEPQHSFREDIGHAAAETYLVTQLTFTLLKYLGVGYRWMIKFAALALYACFLMPGFLQVGWCYFFDKRIHRSIVYGAEPRNRLDLYLPENLEAPRPVVAFVTGGAWIIGYKAWGCLLGLQLVEKDVIVACIDYRNFPQGTISEMVEDVSQALSFICNNITRYGGDLNRLYLAGQSAGAHLSACALVEQARKECVSFDLGKETEEFGRVEAELTWRASQFKAYLGISGGYNLYKLVDHFHNRGLYRRIFLSIMEGEGSLLRYSPELRMQSFLIANVDAALPPIHLFHGTADYSIPHDASTSFAEILTSLGVQVTTRLYEGKTHTDLFLQDPLRGGYDALLADILAIVYAGDTEAQSKDASASLRRRLVPEFLLQLAHRVSPF